MFRSYGPGAFTHGLATVVAKSAQNGAKTPKKGTVQVGWSLYPYGDGQLLDSQGEDERGGRNGLCLKQFLHTDLHL